MMFNDIEPAPQQHRQFPVFYVQKPSFLLLLQLHSGECPVGFKVLETWALLVSGGKIAIVAHTNTIN